MEEISFTGVELAARARVVPELVDACAGRAVAGAAGLGRRSLTTPSTRSTGTAGRRPAGPAAGPGQVLVSDQVVAECADGPDA